jgi:hypothetical protein
MLNLIKSELYKIKILRTINRIILVSVALAGFYIYAGLQYRQSVCEVLANCVFTTHFTGGLTWRISFYGLVFFASISVAPISIDFQKVPSSSLPIKNIVAKGFGRVQIYLTKMALSLCLVLASIILQIVLVLLFGSFLLPFGTVSNPAEFLFSGFSTIAAYFTYASCLWIIALLQGLQTGVGTHIVVSILFILSTILPMAILPSENLTIFGITGQQALNILNYIIFYLRLIGITLPHLIAILKFKNAELK